MTVHYPDAVEVYRGAGWTPLPLPEGKKTPPPAGHTGEAGKDPDLSDYARWKLEYPTGNTGLRLAEGWIALDLDDYGSKHGAVNLEQFAADHELPALPPTISSSSRGTGRSGIYYFRFNPALMAGRKFLPEVCANVELIHHGYRYACVWPSIHPDGGALYRWRTTGNEIMPEALIPNSEHAAGFPVKWLMAVSFKVEGEAASGVRSSGTRTATASALMSKRAVEVWLADQHGDGMPWRGLFESTTDKLQSKVLEGTRYAAMRWATSLVVGDVMAERLPGIAVYDLEAECRALYETPPPGKDRKSFTPVKDRDFWNLVAGAIAHYDEGGPWRDRIEDGIEAGRVARWLAEHGTLPMDDVEVEPETEAEPVPDSAPIPPPIPEASLPIPPIEEDDDWHWTPSMAADDGAGLVLDDSGGVVADAEAVARIAAMDPDERAAFVEIVREAIEQHLEDEGRAKIARVELDRSGLARNFDTSLRKFTREDAERWGREARALVRSRASLSNEFIPTIHPHWIGNDWLPKSSLVSLISRPSVGKTIMLVDMACRLAYGIRWQGSKTEQTPVLYLAFEAAASVRIRVAAWNLDPENRDTVADVEKTHSELVRRDGAIVTPSNLWVADTAGVNLRSPAGRSAITRHMDDMRAATGSYPGVIIVDTLAQAFGGGDENAAQAMGELVNELQMLMSEHPELTIILAHHTPKATGDDEWGEGRGSGALRGVVSVELAIKKMVVEGPDKDSPVDTGIISLKRTKARDGEVGIIRSGIKRMITLVNADGEVLEEDGEPKQTVVWGEPTPYEMGAAVGIGVGASAGHDEMLKIEVHRIAGLVLDDLGWLGGAPPKGFTKTAIRAKWGTDATLGKVGNDRLRPAIAEVLAEREAEMKADHEAEVAEADGVD